MSSKRVEAAIDMSALKNNYSKIKELSGGARIISVVKADAYGHGACECAHVIEECGGDMFAVACLDEAKALRAGGITSDILILGVTPPPLAGELKTLDLIQSVGSEEYADELAKTGYGPYRIHIKADTGMSRLGLYCHGTDDAAEAADGAEKILSHKELICEGIFTHFACSDNIESNMTERQFAAFTALCGECEKRGINIGLRHCCNSAAILNYPGMKLDAVRAGILLYGLSPSGEGIPSGFMPCMTLVTSIAQINHIRKGDTVSYGAAYTAAHDMTAATVSIGYADGFSRLLSDKAHVVINGKRAPVIGRICMDLCMADVTGIECAPGDEVIVFGSRQTVDELASLMGTINYELICSVKNRVPRRYI